MPLVTSSSRLVAAARARSQHTAATSVWPSRVKHAACRASSFGRETAGQLQS